MIQEKCLVWKQKIQSHVYMQELYLKAVNHQPVLNQSDTECRVQDVNSAQTIQQVNTSWIIAGNFKVNMKYEILSSLF